MDDQTLVKTRRNQVFQLLQSAGVDPALFEWGDVSSLHHSKQSISRLFLRSDPAFYFDFDYKSGQDWTTCVPGRSLRFEKEYPGSWDLQITNLVGWALRVSEELQARDLWGEMARYAESVRLGPPADQDDQAISGEEVDSIADAVERLKGELGVLYELNEEQVRFVDGRLDYLAESARRQTRFAWVHTAIGVFVTIAWAISPEDLAEFWEVVKGAFGVFVTLLGPGG